MIYKLDGLRIMVVEDELLVSLLIEDILIEEGCEIVGPYATVPDALDAALYVVADLAVLDVNLRGSKVYPVAEALERRNIPFLLLSGYGEDAVPKEHPHWQVCSKPFQIDDLVAALTAQLIHI